MNMHSRSALQNIFYTKLPDLQYIYIYICAHSYITMPTTQGKRAYVCIYGIGWTLFAVKEPQICTRFQFSRKCI